MKCDDSHPFDFGKPPERDSLTDDSISMRSGGAYSLLNSCVQLRAGHKLAIVEESADSAFYDKFAPAITAEVARQMGASVERIEVPEDLAPDKIVSVDTDCDFLASLRRFDHVVFFSRLGDQIRFADNSKLPPATMCYTLAESMLNSSFGTACHHGMCEIKEAIDNAVLQAELITVTCPLGTNYRGSLRRTDAVQTDVSIKRFPMLMHAPVDARYFQGQVILSRFLVGTGSRYYEPYCLPLAQPVVAHVEGNQIVDFSGDRTEADRIRQHYRDVAARFDIDTWFVHSWHAGIHPRCRFDDNALENIMRWSSSAFGNPRLLHFHTCGNYAPGEISWNIVDPTVTLDGIKLWEHGHLRPERLPACKQLLQDHPNLARHFDHPQTNIGL